MKTPAERMAKMRQGKLDAGLRELRLWLPQETHEVARAAAEKAARKHLKTQRKG